MQELKGLNTTEFYSRFFVETALENHVTASSAQIKELGSIAEKFLTRFHSVHKMTSKDELFDHQNWFHGEILARMGYKGLEAFFYKTNGAKGLPVRGKIELIDGEELWVLEGSFGATHRDTDSLQELPHCSSLAIFGDQQSELQIDKTCDYHKHIRQILAEKNPCSWILFLAGEKMYLFERAKTLEMGAFLEVNWLEVYANKDQRVFKAIIGLFGFDAFKVVNGDISHNQLAETAHREAHGVTRSLKYSVRDALELLINEVLYYHRNVSPSVAIAELEKKHTNDEIAKILADEGLRYLYRLLFLFFVESRGRESEILPIKSRGYSLGYSLENIRNLELKRVSGTQSGNYIQETLQQTFNIMFYGVELQRDENEKLFSSGFECPRIGTLLFDPKKTPVLTEVILRDLVMKEVISKLSISELGTGKKKKTTRISYANLGLNQLGAVYEGLLSLKPVITEAEYCTAILGTRGEEFLIPREDVKKFSKETIKSDEDEKVIVHKKGEFLFRTMGYERKYSASFYTDETLTKCLVKECLEEHFKIDQGKPNTKKIEAMKVLEPAMGSGAFLNETANQLAIYYAEALVRENKDTKNNTKLERVNLIAKAKEYIMRNCLYGVDLNPMATELAKVSLWLNCVHKSGSFAFHDFKIRRGNSLVGAFLRQSSNFSNKIHHFLVPLPAMVDTYLAAVELADKKRPFFGEKELAKLKEIKKGFEKASDEIPRLDIISKKIDDFYAKHSEKRTKFQQTIVANKVTTSDMESFYHDYVKDNQEYNKLRSVMDYWCSLWFWNPDDIQNYPSLAQFLNDVENILEKGSANFNRSRSLKQITEAIPFFHFDLEYPEVFSNGGFDLVLGNPPWAQLSWSDRDFFSSFDHSYLVKDISAADEKKYFLKDLEKSSEVQSKYHQGLILVEGIRNFLANSASYPFKDGSKTNTYKYFWQRSHVLTKSECTYGLIKQGGILTDSGMDELRPTYYKEIASLYRFINEKNLFDVHNLVQYVVSVFKKNKVKNEFKMIDNLYHPLTIDRCKKASSRDRYPGAKDEDGYFDLNGHPERILTITDKELKELTMLEGKDEKEYLTVSLPTIHGKPEWKLIQKAINAEVHLGDNDFFWTTMFDETAAQKKGLIEEWTKPHKDISKAVLTGPNIEVGNPFFKQPNVGCKNNRDYSCIDLNEVAEDYFPATKYRLTNKGMSSQEYLEGRIEKYKVACKEYVSLTGSRTFCSVLIAPKVAHVNIITSLDFGDDIKNVYISGLCSSVIFDFYARAFTNGHLTRSFWSLLPFEHHSEIEDSVLLRCLRLNCVASSYTELWKSVFKASMKNNPSVEMFSPGVKNSKLTSIWNYSSALRDSDEREQALCEIDALVAMLMGVSSDDLIKLYRSQFGALQKKFKDLPGQNEEDSFPRASLMAEAYQMFLKHFNVTEKQVLEGYFQKSAGPKNKVA